MDFITTKVGFGTQVDRAQFFRHLQETVIKIISLTSR